MPPITVSAEVNRSAEEVFSYATDPSRFSEWQKGVVSGHIESHDAALKVGDRCHTTRHIGFSDRPDTSELVCLDPPRQWSVRGLTGPIRAVVDVAVEPISQTSAAADYRPGVRRPRHRSAPRATCGRTACTKRDVGQLGGAQEST